MNFSEIENMEEQTEKQKETPQMSIGQQLEIMSKVKEIEYQNSLVMLSLEKYNNKYEQLKTEQTELLDNANHKIDKLQQSNEMLNQNLKILLKSLSQRLEKEVSTLSDKTQSLIRDTSKDIDSLLTSKLDDLSTKSTEYISEVENLKKDAKNRFESFYGRKKWIDYLVIGNLTIVPVLLIVLTYWVFFKK